METISESLLSGELQELYLQNKEWMSQLLFLEDEIRFLQKVFAREQLHINQKNNQREVELISESLLSLETRINNLKEQVGLHQHKLEAIFKDPKQFIDIMIIEDHANITQKTQELLYLNRILKDELYKL